MGDNDDPSDTTNRRSVLKTVGAGALATTAIGGVASAENLASDDEGIGPAECLDPRYQTRCVDSGCDCSGCNCECETVEEQRLCCKDFQGGTHCHPWNETGNCCTSC